MAAQKKVNVLLLGGGAVGTIAALNIESGGLGNVTAVLRSNYAAVKENGYTIRSIDHGNFEGWRPSQGKLIYVTPNFGNS
jgi:ketopantoate reductase